MNVKLAVAVAAALAAFWRGNGVVTIEHAAMLLCGGLGAFLIERNLRRIGNAIRGLESRLSNLESNAQQEEHDD